MRLESTGVRHCEPLMLLNKKTRWNVCFLSYKIKEGDGDRVFVEALGTGHCEQQFYLICKATLQSNVPRF